MEDTELKQSQIYADEIAEEKEIADAIILNGVSNENEGVSAEYKYLSKKYGQQNKDWQLNNQQLIQKKGKYYDKMDITLSNGTKKTVYFDITKFYGKY